MEAEKSHTVFVVDDDASVRKALKRLLSANGYQVLTFDCAEAFLHSDYIRDKACLVLDIRLPGISGLDLYERLVSAEITNPVIFMTAHDSPQWLAGAAEAGAAAYLRKPFDQQLLLDAIHLACGRRQVLGSNSDSRG
jgi:FixJ family two-component response regulator